MRTHRITGVVVSSALIASLAGGVFGATSASADAPRHPALAAHPAVPSAPDASAIIAQAKLLGKLAGVATPVTDLIEDALATPVSTDTVTKDATAATAAITAAAPAAPATPAIPAVPATPALPSLGSPAGKAALAPGSNRDVTSDALAALQKQVDALVKAVTALDPAGLLTAATGVVTGLVNLVVATVLGGGLPAPDLPGLPALPALPAVPALPVAPAAPAVPAAPALPAL